MAGLKVWQRLGVVPTILWMLGAGYTQFRLDTDNAAEHVQAQFQACSDAVDIHRSNDFKACFNDARIRREAASGRVWGDVALTAFAPPLVAWLLIYLMVIVSRWVWAGRSQT